MNIVPIDGGVCASLGFESAAASAGIKNPEKKRLDCALVVSKRKASVAGFLLRIGKSSACFVVSKRYAGRERHKRYLSIVVMPMRAQVNKV
jgi:N-acetylglutamate synthase/N-acetylornithine aminotransferase